MNENRQAAMDWSLENCEGAESFGKDIVVKDKILFELSSVTLESIGDSKTEAELQPAFAGMLMCLYRAYHLGQQSVEVEQ